MNYKVHLMRNKRVYETHTYNNEESYGDEIADWCGCNYYVKEYGNVAYVQTDKNHDDDYDSLD